MGTNSSYLRSGRLHDVLALIQVLAYDKQTYRSEDGLTFELQSTPQSGNSWVSIAREHPEFFRVRSEPDRKPRVALLARYVLPYETLPNGEEKRPPLEINIANKLLELAIALHDKQLANRNKWLTVALPITVAVISSIAVITGATINALSK